MVQFSLKCCLNKKYTCLCEFNAAVKDSSFMIVVPFLFTHSHPTNNENEKHLVIDVNNVSSSISLAVMAIHVNILSYAIFSSLSVIHINIDFDSPSVMHVNIGASILDTGSVRS